jgi:hypothetical protein
MLNPRNMTETIIHATAIDRLKIAPGSALTPESGHVSVLHKALLLNRRLRRVDDDFLDKQVQSWNFPIGFEFASLWASERVNLFGLILLAVNDADWWGDSETHDTQTALLDPWAKRFAHYLDYGETTKLNVSSALGFGFGGFMIRQLWENLKISRLHFEFSCIEAFTHLIRVSELVEALDVLQNMPEELEERNHMDLAAQVRGLHGFLDLLTDSDRDNPFSWRTFGQIQLDELEPVFNHLIAAWPLISHSQKRSRVENRTRFLEVLSSWFGYAEPKLIEAAKTHCRRREIVAEPWDSCPDTWRENGYSIGAKLQWLELIQFSGLVEAPSLRQEPQTVCPVMLAFVNHLINQSWWDSDAHRSREMEGWTDALLLSRVRLAAQNRRTVRAVSWLLREMVPFFVASNVPVIRTFLERISVKLLEPDSGALLKLIISAMPDYHDVAYAYSKSTMQLEEPNLVHLKGGGDGMQYLNSILTEAEIGSHPPGRSMVESGMFRSWLGLVVAESIRLGRRDACRNAMLSCARELLEFSWITPDPVTDGAEP